MSLTPSTTGLSSQQRVRGTVALAGAGVDHLVTRVHEFHRAIADLPFKALAPLPGVNVGSEPTRVIHDGITDGVYSAVRGVAKLLFKGADAAMRIAERGGDATPAPVNPKLDLAVGALSGAVGDHMARSRNPLAPRLGFYSQGQRLVLRPEALRVAYPAAGERLVIFIHGLCCNESTWDFYTEGGNTPYGPRLAQELGYTPLYVRYNSGLHISQNGLGLARQLERLVAHWPVPVREIVLVGHSMGGLVARSACAYGLQRTAGWTNQVRHLICLGSPHLGAPLERVTHAATGLMDHLPLTRPLGRLLNARSRGITDLRYGYVNDADWRGRDPQTQFDAYRNPIARLPDAQYHFIGASLGSPEAEALHESIGDGLVQVSSATARSVAGGEVDTAVLFRTHHIRLVNHPVIYAQIRQRLTA